MAKFKVNDKARRALIKRVVANAEITGFFIVGQIQQVLSKGQPVRRSASGDLVGLAPSKPGQAPRVVTGRLRQSIFHQVRRGRKTLRLTIGTAAIYAKYLEPPASLNRPFIVSTIRKKKAQIIRRLRRERK